MSLTLQYELVQHTLSSIGSNVIRYGALAFSQSAQVGEPAISENAWDDPDGTWDIKGYREFFAYETAAPSNNRLVYNGFVLSRTYHRDASFRTGAARRITVETSDGNTALGWRILFDGTGANSAKRPAETAGARIAWLVNSSDRLPSLYAHPTYFGNPTHAMDACDYRGQRYNDVLADVANTTGYNFFVQYDEGRQRSELLFLDPDGFDYTSTLSLSNSLTDINSSTVFAPSEDAELHRDPSRIAGGVYLAYDGGSLYQTRQSIYDEFALVDQTAPLGNVKSETKARAIATRYQDDNDEEDDRITCSVVVPAASVNLIRPGHRVDCKFTHFPGWEDFRSTRVMKRTVIQEEEIGEDYYRIALELSAVRTPCIAYDTYGNTITDTASGYRWYLTHYGSVGDYVQSDPEGLTVYGGSTAPGAGATRPIPGTSGGTGGGGWTFRQYGQVDASMPQGHYDAGAAINGNRLTIFTVGPGTLTVWLVDAGSTPAWTLSGIDQAGPAGPDTWTSLATGVVSFPSLTITISDTAQCLHAFSIEGGGNPTGYGGFDWVGG